MSGNYFRLNLHRNIVEAFAKSVNETVFCLANTLYIASGAGDFAEISMIYGCFGCDIYVLNGIVPTYNFGFCHCSDSQFLLACSDEKVSDMYHIYLL